MKTKMPCPQNLVHAVYPFDPQKRHVPVRLTLPTAFTHLRHTPCPPNLVHNTCWPQTRHFAHTVYLFATYDKFAKLCPHQTMLLLGNGVRGGWGWGLQFFLNTSFGNFFLWLKITSHLSTLFFPRFCPNYGFFGAGTKQMLGQLYYNHHKHQWKAV